MITIAEKDKRRIAKFRRVSTQIENRGVTI